MAHMSLKGRVPRARHEPIWTPRIGKLPDGRPKANGETGKGSQLDDWLAFAPGLLIRRRLAKNIPGVAETAPSKGHRSSRDFKEQMEMDGLYDRTTESDVMKSTFT